MLKRKIESVILEHFDSKSSKILLIDGARQVGKTTSVRSAGRMRFRNFVEVNMLEDSLQDCLFAGIRKKEDFYFQLSMLAGDRLGTKEDTLVFIDEIQAYPELLTLLKFLADDARFTYVASGSLLGVTLAETSSIPMGRIRPVRMYPLTFEEFLFANGWSATAFEMLRIKFQKRESLDDAVHVKLLDLFRKYLLVGGLPEAVNVFIETQNIFRVREIHREIASFYAIDAAKYDEEHSLKIRRIYELIPSNMGNKKKRVFVDKIENKRGKTFKHYEDEFDYLKYSGIALQVQAVANPVFPLTQTATKNFIKLYLNDVGLLTSMLYGTNIRPVLDDSESIDLGSVYETVVATELAAHDLKLYYYFDRAKGEVDYLIDDFETLSVLPIEVKSGKNYRKHSALNGLLSSDNATVKKAFVLSNAREVSYRGEITCLPIYYIPFLVDCFPVH